MDLAEVQITQQLCGTGGRGPGFYVSIKFPGDNKGDLWTTFWSKDLKAENRWKYFCCSIPIYLGKAEKQW